MEVNADDADIRQTVQRTDSFVDFGVRNSEFAVGLSGRDVFMRAGVDIRVDPQRYPGGASGFGCQRVNDFQLLERFTIEGKNILPERIPDLFVAFGHTGKNDFRSGAAALDGQPYFVSTHTVDSQSGFADRGNDTRVEIRLQRIMHFVTVFSGFGDCLRQRVGKQLHVVEIERCVQFLQLVGILSCTHILYSVLRRKNSPKMNYCWLKR